tara:strand:- start:617 stop:847 length:231 start_codon:yes stop_codon:yes gene_type:complete
LDIEWTQPDTVVNIVINVNPEDDNHDPETCDECIVARERGQMDATGYYDIDGATLCGNCQNYFKGDGDLDTCKECI